MCSPDLVEIERCCKKIHIWLQFGFDTAENEPQQICYMIWARDPYVESFLYLLRRQLRKDIGIHKQSSTASEGTRRSCEFPQRTAALPAHGF